MEESKYKRIIEMAVSRKNIVDRIGYYSPDIARQIMKLYMFPKSKDVRHWTQNLIGHLRKLRQKFISTNQYPPVEFYQKYLIKGFVGDHDYYMNLKLGIEEKYEMECLKDYARSFPSYAEFEKYMIAMMEQISEILSKTSTENISPEIYEFVKQITD